MDFLRIENGMTRDAMILRYLKHKEAVNTGDLRTKNGNGFVENMVDITKLSFQCHLTGIPFFCPWLGHINWIFVGS